VYVCRDSRLRTFLLLAQNETFDSSSMGPFSLTSRLDIHLLNGHAITLDDVAKSDSATDVRDKLAKSIQLPEDLANYFGLFLVATEEAAFLSDGPSCGGLPNLSVIRQLQDFESPLLSLQALQHAVHLGPG
jgi:hypothetical protein